MGHSLKRNVTVKFPHGDSLAENDLRRSIYAKVEAAGQLQSSSVGLGSF